MKNVSLVMPFLFLIILIILSTGVAGLFTVVGIYDTFGWPGIVGLVVLVFINLIYFGLLSGKITIKV